MQTHQLLIASSFSYLKKVVEALLRIRSVNINKSESEQEMAGFLQSPLHAFGKNKVVNSYKKAV